MDAIFENAKWIGAAERNLHAHTMSVFQISCQVQIPEGSTRAGFCFGGNDRRLTDRNKNLMGIAVGRGESYICLTLDIGPIAAGQPACFTATRYGYANGDGQTPLHRAEIPPEVLGRSNCHSPQTLRIRCVYGQIEVSLGGALLTKTEDFFQGDVWNLNPLGAGNNFICFPLLCDIGVKQEAGQQAVFSELEIRNYREPCSLLYRTWENGAHFDGEDTGRLWLFDPSHGGMPVLRRGFQLSKAVKTATIRATARGVYILSVNGKRVGQDWFAPGLSQYNRTHYYQTYDVTALLSPGSNELRAELGEGWWSGAITFSGENWNFFGDRQSLLARLDITYQDGSTDTLLTAPAEWQVSTDGPVVYSSFFQGETCDHRREGTETWQPAVEIPLSHDNAFIGDMIRPPFGQVFHMDYDAVRFLPQRERGVQMVKVLTARSVTEPRPGVYVYDMGQNMAGVPEFEVMGTAGQRLTLRYAEVLYPDMPEYADNAGMLMLENIRGALAQDVVILKDGLQTVRPRFTYHGYRYLELSGVDTPLPPETVRGLSLSSVDVTAEFACSDPDITRLYENISWSLLDNCISIPTDCPQRNERMGWNGDLSVFSRTMVQMSDCADFLQRHLQALRDTQSPEGRFDDVAPVGGGFGGILWGSAGITVPWELYRQTGSLAVLQEHFDAMCRYGRFLHSKLDERGLVSEGPLGDWLGPENEKNEPQLLWQSYYIYDLRILLHCAELLEAPDIRKEFAPLLASAEAAFRQWYLDPVTGQTVFSSEAAARGDSGMAGPAPVGPPRAMPEKTAGGRYLMDTQTSYAVPLALGILSGNDAEQARIHLGNSVRRSNTDDSGTVRPPYSLMTGFIGTAWILHALSEGGMDAEAWRMLRNAEYPSWLYPVRQGATTIWERLDSFTLDRGFGGNNSMNSFNHYSFGAVGSWMLSRILGFAGQDENGVMRLAPVPDPDRIVTWAEGSVVAGDARYRLRWEIKNETTCFSVTVPSGKTAILTVAIPAHAKVITEGPVSFDCERQQFLLSAGQHRISVSDVSF